MPVFASRDYVYDIVIVIYRYIYLIYTLYVLMVFLEYITVMFSLHGHHITLFLILCVFHVFCAI